MHIVAGACGEVTEVASAKRHKAGKCMDQNMEGWTTFYLSETSEKGLYLR
jgi:hypothetical protein